MAVNLDSELPIHTLSTFSSETHPFFLALQTYCANQPTKLTNSCEHTYERLVEFRPFIGSTHASAFCSLKIRLPGGRLNRLSKQGSKWLDVSALLRALSPLSASTSYLDSVIEIARISGLKELRNR